MKTVNIIKYSDTRWGYSVSSDLANGSFSSALTGTMEDAIVEAEKSMEEGEEYFFMREFTPIGTRQKPRAVEPEVLGYAGEHRLASGGTEVRFMVRANEVQVTVLRHDEVYKTETTTKGEAKRVYKSFLSLGYKVVRP